MAYMNRGVWENMKEKDHLKDLSTDRKIIQD
jgi:hypothetical protein